MLQDDIGGLSQAETVAASVLTFLVAACVLAYVVDWCGGTIHPFAILLASLASAGALLRASRSYPRIATRDLLPFALLVCAVLGALLWLAWPALLPLGGGGDLIHHLQLIDYIERHWRLPHDPAAVLFIGNMVNYTPASHLLAAMAGAWTRTDGLHVMHGILAVAVALKAGLVFLIARRMLPRDVPRTAIALASALLLFLPYDYFIGSFAEYSFFAQVVSEAFAVGMWWALVVWDEDPSMLASGLFALMGMGAFLAWPIWIGPPVLLFIAFVLLRHDLQPNQRARHLALALAPIAFVAAVHTLGRVESLAIVRSGGAEFWPSTRRFGWVFLILSATGLLLSPFERRSRVTALLLLVVVMQAAALWGVASATGADSPYMAVKMIHFLICPMAAIASLALAAGWRALTGAAATFTPRSWRSRRLGDGVAWVLLGIVVVAVTRELAFVRLQPATVSEDLFRAGRWVRLHGEAGCVEYLVPNDNTAYWLHLAVLGNPMAPSAGARPPVFVFRDAVLRWITGAGCPVAIADVPALSKDVREDLTVIAAFGHAAVARRGAAKRP